MTSPTHLLTISAVGFALLWGAMMFNGTLSLVFRMIEKGAYPDGRKIPTSITGSAFIDSQLGILVAFFDPLMRSESPSRWLLLCVCNLIGTINTWVLIESRRRGMRNLWLRHTVVFITAWNSFGAAWIAPIYMFFIAKSKYLSRDRTIPLNEARGFPVVVAANALFGLLLLFPERFGLCQAAAVAIWSAILPKAMVLTVVLASRPGTTLTKIATPKTASRPNEDSAWVFASFYAAGTLSTAVHLYVFGASGTAVSLARTFIPAPSNVLDAGKGTYEAFTEGAHLFLQYDCHVLGLACVVFTYYMLQSMPDGESSDMSFWNHSSQAKEKLGFLYIALASVMIGPGAQALSPWQFASAD